MAARVRIDKRGGATGNPTGTYADAPPSSTYRKGRPEVAGSFGGFMGLLFGLVAVAALAGLAGWYLLRRRRNLKAQRALNAAYPHSRGAAGSGGMAGNRGWQRAVDDEESDAWELRDDPSATDLSTPELGAGGEGKRWLNPSTMSLEAGNASTDTLRAEDRGTKEESPFQDQEHEDPFSDVQSKVDK
ncbi:hypothetical protein MNV49_003789 [Pseudohyphozyma bogoriensis]|nr:hypothetical protein MNV49_003789 [Pseudohyphozyma bogoriensis]